MLGDLGPEPRFPSFQTLGTLTAVSEGKAHRLSSLNFSQGLFVTKGS